MLQHDINFRVLWELFQTLLKGDSSKNPENWKNPGPTEMCKKGV